MIIYCMSDIHGRYNEFKQRILQLQDLNFFKIENKDKLILLGDYIDRGPKSLQCVMLAKKLTDKYPNKVIALKGNHEEDFLLKLHTNDWHAHLDTWDGGHDGDFADIQDFVDLYDKELKNISKHVTTYNLEGYPDLVDWLRKLPHYYETENQIFVHANINEQSGRQWKAESDESELLGNYSEFRTGKFYKTIIAGHFITGYIVDDLNYFDIYFDGESHYYLDGGVESPYGMNMLVYDTENDTYHSLLPDGSIHNIQPYK